MDSSVLYSQQKFRFAARRSTIVPSKEVAAETDVITEGIREGSLIDNLLKKATELTRNDRYRVSTLVSTPEPLRTNNTLSNGYIDTYTKHACFVDDTNLQVIVWNYTSQDQNPIIHSIPVESTNIIPILVMPSPGNSEPGLVLTYADLGKTVYFENIDFQSLQHTVKLSAGERIQAYENIDPTGILFATSNGRLILLSLRSPAGKPILKSFDLISSSFLSFIPLLSGASASHVVAGVTGSIASIRASKNLGNGSRSVIVLTENGRFLILTIDRYGQTSKEFEFNGLKNIFFNEIKDLYEASDIDILDCISLDNDNNFLVLTCIKISSQECAYILFTLKQEDDELLVVQGYKLTRYTAVVKKRNNSPKMYLCKPNGITFVVFGDAVVLVETIPQISTDDQNFRRRWEDIITFRSHIDIIGYGFEDAIFPSMIVISKQVGMLQIAMINDNKNARNNSSFVKSHIEQAVFYGGEADEGMGNSMTPLEFDFTNNIQLEEKEIENSVLQVSDELISSKLIYLPPRLASLESHLQRRFEKCVTFNKYVANNFLNDIPLSTKLQIIDDFQKISAAVQIWSIINEYRQKPEYSDIFVSVIQSMDLPVSNNTNMANSNVIENFFYYDVKHLGKFLSLLISTLLSNNSIYYNAAIVIVLKAIKNGAIDIEDDTKYGLYHIDADAAIREGMSAGIYPWIISDDLCFKYAELFAKYYDSINQSESFQNSPEVVGQIISLVLILFFTFNSALSYFGSSASNAELFVKYEQTYKTGKSQWINSLLIIGESNIALQIAESFKDFESIVQVIESESLKINSTKDEQLIYDKLKFYFENFGYNFARTLYEFFVKSDKYQDLLMGYVNYDHFDFLKTFLNSSPKYGRIFWIKNVLDNDFLQAGETLIKISNSLDESIQNKEFELSIAKLSLLTVLESGPNNNFVQEKFHNIEVELFVLEVQNKLFDEMSQLVGPQQDIEINNRVPDDDQESGSEDMKNSQIDKVLNLLGSNLINNRSGNNSVLFHNLKKSLSLLMNKQYVPTLGLIDLLTLLNANTNSIKFNFYNALKIILQDRSLDNYEFQFLQTLIWRRCILADDWAETLGLIQQETKSSEFIQEKISKSVLYQTLLHCFRNNDFSSSSQKLQLPNLEHKLVEKIDDLPISISSKEKIPKLQITALINELNFEASMIEKLIDSYDFSVYFKTVVGTAHNNSNSRLLINYETLELQS